MTNAAHVYKLNAVIMLRRTNKSIVTLFLLLVFSLQVQASFACKIADYSGPAENCCCDGNGEQQRDVVVEDGSACCEHSQNVGVKGSDPAQDNEPVTVSKSFELDLPPVLVALVAIWLDQPLLPSSPIHDLADVPPHSLGTQTYLATQRLRI